MKRCASCGREIAESASVCDGCEKWAQYHVPAASATPVPDLQVSLPAAGRQGGYRRRTRRRPPGAGDGGLHCGLTPV